MCVPTILPGSPKGHCASRPSLQVLRYSQRTQKGNMKGVVMNPQANPDNTNTNISGMSDGLEEFLKNWCNDEIDDEDVAKMLHSPEGAQYRTWVPQELRAAYQAGVLTPQFLSMACDRQFDSPKDVGDWLQQIWPLWFDQPFAAPPSADPAPSQSSMPNPSSSQ